jgi:hypothetical protein
MRSSNRVGNALREPRKGNVPSQFPRGAGYPLAGATRLND